MKYLRYKGAFWSTNNVKWEVQILQEATSAFVVGELRFPYEDPLTIEWKETTKDDAICSSMASLTIVSPGDRTYEDLYSITPGNILMNVYRAGVLYWSGTLDPEFYEEPYSTYDEYEVTLMFGDFGILDRYKYDLTGLKTLQQIFDYALGKTNIYKRGTSQDYISTSIGSTQLTLSMLSLRSDNFYDEDGEASTLWEVVEGMLRPLGIRLMQRNGYVYLYDLNGLYNNASSEQVAWNSTDQVLGVDTVANNAKITFSPYADSEVLNTEIECGEVLAQDKLLYFDQYDSSAAERVDSFRFMTSTTGSGIAAKSAASRYCRIEALNDGSNADALAFCYVEGRYSLSSGWTSLKLGDPKDKSHTLLMKTYRSYIPQLSSGAALNYKLRLTMEMLIDSRYNPFVSAGNGNEGSNTDLVTRCFGYVMIPATVTLYSEEGTALMHYDNSDVAARGTGNKAMRSTIGQWKNGAAPCGSCWLEWYDPNDRAEKTGVLDWKKNRQCVGLTTDELNAPFRKIAEGQYMPYPPQAGYIEVCIYTGVWPYDYGEKDFGNPTQPVKKKLYEMIRWMLYKAPIIDVVNDDAMLTDAKSDDVEYTGVLNADAKEELTIDTICGTMAAVVPTAKGSYIDSTTLLPISQLTRAGRTTQAEQLLIGTLYSQYADRKTKLSGTVKLLNSGIKTYTELMQGTKKFILLGDVQNCASDESEMTIVELRPDEYED